MNLELVDLKSRNIIGKVTLAEIKVSVERIDDVCNLPMKTGDYFYMEDSKLYVPEGKYICIWTLQSMMPIFPILTVRDKLDDAHWVKKVKNFSCPDPKGLVQYRLDVIE
jgi:carbon-monoxide dehydrogenase iron sulfur subunit